MEYGYAGQDSDMVSGDVAKAARKQTHLEQIRDNAERAAARAGAIRSRLDDTLERLVGSMPRQDGREAGSALNGSGFISGAGAAVERIHVELTAIDDILTRLSEII
jgi:hypothetical protein